MIPPGRGIGRQTVDTGQAVLLFAVCTLAVAGVAKTAVSGLVQLPVALTFGALIVLGEFARIWLPGNRETAPIGAAGALGYALLPSIGTMPAAHDTWQLVAVTACAVVLGVLPHIAVGRSVQLDSMARRVLAVALAGVAYRSLGGRLPAIEQEPWLTVAVMVTIVVLALAVDVGIAATLRVSSLGTRLVTAVRDDVRAEGALDAAVAATGLLIALAVHVMGMIALLVFVAPLLVTQIAFRRYAGIRATYLQTIRSLSRLTEVAGYVENGHSRRVSQLAMEMGRELGMGESDLLELEYAALMHDIGQLSLREAIPGGATVLTAPEEQRRIAELGAEVIRQTGVLDRVAEVVRRQADPHRDDTCADTTLPLASRIIKVANGYDDLVGGSPDRGRQAASLEHMRLDTAREYDPRVVEALTRVVESSAPASA